ncbi:retrovirus-related Pol polyprotein from transposon TNT 1-94 [Trichonephila clavipes]|nr:retrovirus-related Pol polyprotein from transposon TNT 1-94 [Trichonephila clavipes]
MRWNQHRRTYGPAYHSEWHFDGPKDDNDRPHRAHLVENMLEAETIQRMEWPVCSPDLNPIEHVWDMLGRRIAARPRPPATVRDLEIALLEEWNSIPQSLIDNLIASMANSYHWTEVSQSVHLIQRIIVKSAAEAHRMLSNTYGEAAIRERTCREWFQRFKNDDFEVEDQHGGGREKVF